MSEPRTEPEKSPMGRRERNKQKVRNNLYCAALKLFTEKGYEQTSVDEIAAEADVARGTFFNHFQRKEDLISAWGEQRRVRLRSGLDAPSEARQTTLQLALERCMSTLATINEGERDVTRAMLTAWVKAGRPLQEEPFTGEIFAEVVGAAKLRGEVRRDIDPRHVGYLLRDAYLGALYRWSQEPEGASDLHAELYALCEIIVTGVLTPDPGAQAPTTIIP